MPPTESTILTTFLLTPSPLPSILPLSKFRSHFPPAVQSSTEIKTLYRDLQSQRARTTDAVARNIKAEVKRGEVQRRIVVRERRREEGDGDDEVEIEGVLYGSTSNIPLSKPHTLKSIIPELESAAEEVEDEVRRLEEEAEKLLEEMRGTVGGLSDLRYGRLANGQLREQVLDGLKRLEESCEK